jgi:hypothetical protein
MVQVIRIARSDMRPPFGFCRCSRFARATSSGAYSLVPARSAVPASASAVKPASAKDARATPGFVNENGRPFADWEAHTVVA